MTRPPIITALAVLALAACAPRDRTSSSPGANGGTLVVAAIADADLLLPVVATTQLASHVGDRIFPHLVDMTLDLNISDDSGFVPMIARSWDHRDSLTLVFHLDPRARWNDGVPITADDVVYTFGVYRDTMTQSPYRQNLDPIAAVTREDSLTVVFRFHRRYPEQLYDATYHMTILPKHALDSIPNERLASSAFAKDPTVGAGPFRFAHYESGAELVVEADTTWFLGRPHLDRIVWRIMPDVSAAVTALLAGEADAMEVILQPDEIARVKRSNDLTLMPYPSPFIGGVIFNTRRPLFADRTMRRAIAMAVDRETIVRSVFGEYGEVPTSAVSRMVWVSQAPARQIAWDTAGAARLLDSLGWRPGPDGIRQNGGRRLRFTLMTPTTSRVRGETAVHIQAQLKRVGIDVQIQPLEINVFDRRSRSGDFETMMFNRTLDPNPSAIGQFFSHAAIRDGDNFGAYDSPGFDSLLTRASAASGRATSLPLWQAALDRLNDDAPALFMFSPRNQAAIHTRFEHVTIRSNSWLATVATWSVAPDRRLPRDR